MGESRPRVGWLRVPRCPVAHRKWGHRQQPAASRGAPATAPSPPPWAWAGRTGCVPWDCPALGSGKVICATPPGQEDGGTPPHTPGDQPSWAQSLQPRPPGHRPPPCPHSRAPEPSGGGAEPASRFSETGRRASRPGLRFRDVFRCQRCPSRFFQASRLGASSLTLRRSGGWSASPCWGHLLFGT